MQAKRQIKSLKVENERLKNGLGSTEKTESAGNRKLFYRPGQLTDALTRFRALVRNASRKQIAVSLE